MTTSILGEVRGRSNPGWRASLSCISCRLHDHLARTTYCNTFHLVSKQRVQSTLQYSTALYHTILYNAVLCTLLYSAVHYTSLCPASIQHGSTSSTLPPTPSQQACLSVAGINHLIMCISHSCSVWASVSLESQAPCRQLTYEATDARPQNWSPTNIPG